jgi:hypothetical protein
MRNKFFQIIFFAVVFLGMPVFARADVHINEVAWMGTTGSQYEEWIELYNDGSATSLDGWKIYKAGGSTTLISLSGSISAGQYLLVCRTTPSVPNPLSGSCDVTGSFGGSGLNNTSEHIILKNSGGTSVDEINATSGWPAGDSSTKDTMQKSGSGWITSPGTPGAANASNDNGGGGGNNDDDTNEEDQEEDTTEETESISSAETAKIYPTRLLKVEAPKIVIVGSPAHFKAQALDYDRSDMFKGHYTWNMGDGKVREFALGFRETNDGFDYVYEYPGTYSVSVKYYHSFLDDVPAELEQRFTIEATSAAVTVSRVYPDGAIELKNTSGNALDVSGWVIRDITGKTFTIPEDSFLAPGKTVVFSAKITKINAISGVSIYTSANMLAFSTQAVAAKTSYSGSTSSAKKSVTPPPVEDGEVLGAMDTGIATSSVAEERHGSSNIIWILLFIILILVAVIAVLFLRKTEKTDDGYELIDE